MDNTLIGRTGRLEIRACRTEDRLVMLEKMATDAPLLPDRELLARLDVTESQLAKSEQRCREMEAEIAKKTKAATTLGVALADLGFTADKSRCILDVWLAVEIDRTLRRNAETPVFRPRIVP